MDDLNEIKEILFNKKFIKDGEYYPDTKVLLVKGGTKEGIEIGLSKYCSEEYAKVILEWYNRKVLELLEKMHKEIEPVDLRSAGIIFTEIILQQLKDK